MSKTKVNNPLSKGAFKTFIGEVIKLHFYQNETQQLRSLSELREGLFPSNTEEEDFNTLVEFSIRVIDAIIKTGKPNDVIQETMNEDYEYKSDMIDIISDVVNTEKNEVISHMNKDFDNGWNQYKKLNWSIKSVLSGSTENFVNDKFVDMEFSYKSNNSDSIRHKNITFSKKDVGKVLEELRKIKNSLNNIAEIK